MNTCIPWMTLHRLTSIMNFQSSYEVSQILRGGLTVAPALLHRMSTVSEILIGHIRQPCHRVQRGNVDTDGDTAHAAAAQLLRHLRRPVLIDIGDHHMNPRVSEGTAMPRPMPLAAPVTTAQRPRSCCIDNLL